MLHFYTVENAVLCFSWKKTLLGVENMVATIVGQYSAINAMAKWCFMKVMLYEMLRFLMYHNG